MAEYEKLISKENIRSNLWKNQSTKTTNSDAKFFWFGGF